MGRLNQLAFQHNLEGLLGITFSASLFMKLEKVQGLFAKISNLLLDFELPYFKTAKMSYLKLIFLLFVLFFPLTDSPGSDMPHFSNELLVSQRAHVEKLTFSYYLRHGRPSFAFVSFVSERLKDATVSKSK